MSKPKYYWYNHVKKMIRFSYSQEAKSTQELLMLKAIKEAEKDLSSTEDGDLKLNAIKDVIILQKLDFAGAGLKYNYCDRTIQQWCNNFINDVGIKAGY